MPADPSLFERLWAEFQATGRIGTTPEAAENVLRVLTPIARAVRHEMGRRPALDDLISAGAIGLLDALPRFDPTRGVRPETFVGWRIVGAMYDDQRKFAWAKGAVLLKAQRAGAAAEELRHELGRPPSDDEVAEALGITPAELAEVRRLGAHPAPLVLDDDGEEEDAHRDKGRPADHRPDPMRILLAAEARALLLDALKGLPDKQRYTLLLYYFERLTLVQIGSILGLTDARISQIRDEAMDVLVRRLGSRAQGMLEALGE